MWQNVRVVNLSITHDYLVPSLSFNVFMSSGNSNLNLASVTSNFDLGFRQFDGTAAQSLRFVKNMILRKKMLINFNIITRNNCLNKITLIFAVAFLLSDSIFYLNLLQLFWFMFCVMKNTQLDFLPKYYKN